MENVIEAKALWKSYGRTIALRDFSIKVPRASIFLLMGPNGSGKSTLLKIITGLIKPTQGGIAVLGLNPWRNRGVLFAQVGAMFEDHAPPDWASGREFLKYMATLKGSKSAKEDALEAASFFGVDEYWDKPISSYSSGMRRKLALAHAFLRDPQLIMLDDPTVALDKESREALVDRVTNDFKRGRTCLIASHIVTEFEDCATNMGVLSHGRLLTVGTIEEAAKQTGIRSIAIETDKPGLAVEVLTKSGYTAKVDCNIITVEGAESPDELVRLLENQGARTQVREVKWKIWDIYERALALR